MGGKFDVDDGQDSLLRTIWNAGSRSGAYK